ncbi:mCG140112 [Mus musculus]|nr:mCG140112 [Mus musculus]
MRRPKTHKNVIDGPYPKLRSSATGSANSLNPNAQFSGQHLEISLHTRKHQPVFPCTWKGPVLLSEDLCPHLGESSTPNSGPLTLEWQG